MSLSVSAADRWYPERWCRPTSLRSSTMLFALRLKQRSSDPILSQIRAERVDFTKLPPEVNIPNPPPSELKAFLLLLLLLYFRDFSQCSYQDAREGFVRNIYGHLKRHTVRWKCCSGGTPIIEVTADYRLIRRGAVPDNKMNKKTEKCDNRLEQEGREKKNQLWNRWQSGEDWKIETVLSVHVFNEAWGVII